MEIDHGGGGKGLRCITDSLLVCSFDFLLYDVLRNSVLFYRERMMRGMIPRETIKYGIKFVSGLSLEVFQIFQIQMRVSYYSLDFLNGLLIG